MKKIDIYRLIPYNFNTYVIGLQTMMESSKRVIPGLENRHLVQDGAGGG